MYRLWSMFKGMQNGCGCVQASGSSGMHTMRSMYEGMSKRCDPLSVYGKAMFPKRT